MAGFSPNRELLNPKFEGYKLQLISPGVARHGLPYKPTQATASGRSPLSLQEVQSRITHNHLVLSPAPGRVLYIDADRRVVVVDVDLTDITKSPRFNIVYELPIAISTAQAQSETVHREYPSAAFLAEDTAFVSDGRGSLYILNIPAHGPATLLSSFDLIDREASSLPLPFRIHSVARVSDGTAIALLSSRYYDAEVLSLLTEQTAATSSTHPRHHLHHHLHSSEFDVWAARFTFPLNMMRIDSGTLNIVWRRRGEDVPMLVVYDATCSAYTLIGSSAYREIGAPHTPAYEPSADEIAPIPRAGEDLDASNNTTPTKPYPYSWTQTPDVVTVAFPLPSSTPKSHITVLFSPTTLTLHVKGVPDMHEGVRLPRYSAKQLWDRIRPSTSFWTWDRQGEHRFGILSVHLDKMTEGQKWMHVFAAAGTCSTCTTATSTGSEGNDDTDVPETLDPSELYLIREAFEKFTETLRTGEDASGLGLGRGVPSLAQGEMDDEVDDSVGRLASFTWVSEDGSTPPWWKKDSTSPFNLLSTPLPGTDAKLAGLVVKHSIDGLLYAAEETQGGGGMIAPGWKHTGTFSALAFVLASKRDTRFTHHTQNAIFAFENGSVDRGGNVYIYRRSSPNQLCAKQSVLKVGDGNAGSLLGVGAFKNDNKSDSMTILCLCENHLIVLYDVF